MGRNREIRLSVTDGGVILGALTMYAEQCEAETLTSTGEEAKWHQERARGARKILTLMGQMNYAGERGHYELKWVNEE